MNQKTKNIAKAVSSPAADAVMDHDITSLTVGSKILLKWPLHQQQQHWRKGRITSIKKAQHEVCFYKDPDQVTVTVRLTELSWKPVHKKSKPSSVTDTAGKRSLSRSEDSSVSYSATKRQRSTNDIGTSSAALHPDAIKFILAPMVGASELPFRLLCRRYGAKLAYTPMMNSEKFAIDAEYRRREFQTTADDRPLVAHFSANNPQVLLAAAKHIEDQCDAIDLNLGCPQRIAYSGHFGSYLLEPKDRGLVLDIVRTASMNLQIPVFVKIRLLDTVDDTIKLCQQLISAGAKLIAIHARYRVNLVGRTGPGARDGAAHLDQVAEIRRAIRIGNNSIPPSTVPIIANGNIITFSDIQRNLEDTGCEGVMSAEGILDNPALFNGGNPVDSLQLAKEYLDLVEQQHQQYRGAEVPLKTIVFHIRRMCKTILTDYQLLEDCIAADSLQTVRSIVTQAATYQSEGNFRYDPEKAKRSAVALKQRQREASKRKEFEARMIRKAKREGRSDLNYYLAQGAEAPSVEEITELKKQLNAEGSDASEAKNSVFSYWKQHHSQHCYAFHFEPGGCPRDRTCAFLHADSRFADGAAYG